MEQDLNEIEVSILRFSSEGFKLNTVLVWEFTTPLLFKSVSCKTILKRSTSLCIEICSLG